MYTQAIELNEGVFYPMGGFHNIAKSLTAICKGLGVTFLCDTAVAEILVGGSIYNYQVRGKGLPLLFMTVHELIHSHLSKLSVTCSSMQDWCGRHTSELPWSHDDDGDNAGIVLAYTMGCVRYVSMVLSIHT